MKDSTARISRNFIQEIYCVLLEDYRPPAKKKETVVNYTNSCCCKIYRVLEKNCSAEVTRS